MICTCGVEEEFAEMGLGHHPTCPKSEQRQEHENLLAAWHLARDERRLAERNAREWLCEEQRLAHKLWGHPFPNRAFGT
jgi:hypothetical protein